MRIIKAAKKVDEYITTCNNCGSTLGIRRNDLVNNTMVDDDKCEEWIYYCGVCQYGNHLTGSLHNLFPWIMEEEVNDGEIPSSDIVRQHQI